MVEAEWSGEEAQKRVEEAQQNEKEEVEEAQQNEKEEVEVAQQNEEEEVEEAQQNAEETTENSLEWATTAPSTDPTPVSATLSTCLPLKTRTTVSQASQEEVAEEGTPQWQTFPSSPQTLPVTESA